ncbi:hypothetical protein JG687_00015828, partial [Phytophthora cactorum]
GALRGDDVVDVAEFIKSCKPPRSDLASFLSTFEVRHLKYQHKQLAAAWRVPEATIIPYRLPEGVQGMKCYSWLMNIVDDQISHDETVILAK